jgi:hypothetical protein
MPSSVAACFGARASCLQTSWHTVPLTRFGTLFLHTNQKIKLLISTGNQQLAVNAGTVELVTTQGLGAHAEHAPTAAAAAALLCALLRKHGGAVEAMEVGFDAALPACIRMHPENEEVQIAGCMAVFSACWDNDAVQDALREAGVVELLLEAMGRYRSSGRLLAMACAALSNMCDSPETEAYWLAQGGLEAVIAAPVPLPRRYPGQGQRPRVARAACKPMI